MRLCILCRLCIGHSKLCRFRAVNSSGEPQSTSRKRPSQSDWTRSKPLGMDSLRVDPRTGEVFLRLPVPHENIITTPPRDCDVADTVPILNDPKVYKTLVGLPFPYHPHHAEEWLGAAKKKSDKVLENLRKGKVVVDGCPVRHLREMQPNGTELFLEDLSVGRHRWFEVADEDLRERVTKEGSEKPVGDPGIVWTLGGVWRSAAEISAIPLWHSADYFRPSHHGRGIMSAAVGAVINQWMIPHLNGHKIRTKAIEGDIARVRVFEMGTFRVERRPGRGVIEGVHVLEWE